MYVCIICYYYVIINIIIFVLYNSIFAPLGDLKMSLLKMHQSRQLCQRQTATSKSLQMDPRESELPQHTAHPLPQLLCHHPTQSSLRQSLTKGAMWETSWSEVPLKLKTLGLFSTSGQFMFVPKVEGKWIGHFWDGGFGQRDTQAGFSLGLILTWRCLGLSAGLQAVQPNPGCLHDCSTSAATPVLGVHSSCS